MKAAIGCFALLALAGGLLAQEGYTERTLDKDGKLKYRLFTPKSDKAPKDGYKLLFFLPGGTGDENFTGWCKSIYRVAIPDAFLGVQLIAPKWTTKQRTVWPTNYTKAEDMKVPVEDFVEKAIKRLREDHKIAKDQTYTLSWSSGGPAAYVIASEVDEIRGSFVAMSVFRKMWLPKSLRNVKGQKFYIYHSPEDAVCKIALAREAEKTLKDEGAEVRFEEYTGPHGWPLQSQPHPFQSIRKAFEWMAGD